MNGNLPTTDTKKVIIFKHPAHPDEYRQNEFLQLYAWDSLTGGIHPGTAKLACGVVAGSAWNGFFTGNRDGNPSGPRDEDILPDGEYYPHVPDPFPQQTRPLGSSKWAVQLDFDNWPFPHHDMPGGYGGEGEGAAADPLGTPLVSSVTSAVIARDGAYVISKSKDCIERAHLCPRHKSDWF